jgi:hypothetical protein
MPSKEELLDAIKEIQQKEPSYSNCEKLATFYTLLRYLYSEEEGQSRDAFPASNGSEFRQAIAGKDIERVVDVLDEHMEVVMLLFPKEYKEVIRRIREEG